MEGVEEREERKPHYQNPLSFNKHLPYADQLEKEASELLTEIKENLSIAVQKRELWPGVLYWTNRLNRLDVFVTREYTCTDTHIHNATIFVCHEYVNYIHF